jgi:hypothetical protein
MARQPYFSGNYGSALAQVDTRPIMEGARAQAEMYQGLGQNIGGAIEKYQLNKEKNLELDGQIEGTLAGLKDEDSFDFEIELQNNSVMRKLFEKQSKGETGQAEKAKLAGYLSSRSKQQDLQRLRAGQDIATQLKQQNLGLNKQLEAGILKNQQLTLAQQDLLRQMTQLDLDGLPEKQRMALETAGVNLSNLITRGDASKSDFNYQTDLRAALPGREVGAAQRQILDSNVIKGQAGAKVARHDADVATHESPEAIVNRARRDRERQIGREFDTERRTKELQTRADEAYFASGGAQGAGERAKELGEATVKLRQGQAEAQDISNLTSFAPQLGAQGDLIGKRIQSLLDVPLPNGKKMSDKDELTRLRDEYNELKDSDDPADLEKLRTPSMVYYAKYRLLTDDLTQLLGNTPVNVRRK